MRPNLRYEKFLNFASIAAHLLVCKHPYPRDVDEIHDYNIVTDHFIPNNKNLDSSSEETRTYSVSCSLIASPPVPSQLFSVAFQHTTLKNWGGPGA